MGALSRMWESKLGIAAASAVVTMLVFGGGAAVALTVPSNTITSPMIVNGQVKSSDIKDGGVKRQDLAPGLAGQFARVTYSAGVPSITAQSGGLAVVSEPFTGAVRISFPQSMDSCAITATATTGGLTTNVRRSNTGVGNEVVVVGFDEAGGTVETDFDVIGQC